MWCLGEWHDDMIALQLVFVLEAKTAPKVMPSCSSVFVLEKRRSGVIAKERRRRRETDNLYANSKLPSHRFCGGLYFVQGKNVIQTKYGEHDGNLYRKIVGGIDLRR